MGVTYDAGALIAAERGDRSLWALHAGFLAEGVRPTVPAAVLAQVWRGGRSRGQVDVARLLRPCAVEDLSGPAARRAGELLGRSGTADAVDAMVVEGALRRGDAVVTSDPTDVARLADALGAQLVVEVV